MECRPLTAADLPGLLALYRHLVPDDPPLTTASALDRWQQLKSLPGSDIFLGLLAGEPVTTCTLVVIPNLTRGGRPYALIENVVTRTDQRRQGYAGAVMRAAIAAGRAAGCYKIMLLTGSRRPETLRFYESLGFARSKTGFEIRTLPEREKA
jgi:GNAT superfamily N-acetyltransferase